MSVRDSKSGSEAGSPRTGEAAPAPESAAAALLACDLLCEKGTATGAGARPRYRSYFHKDNIELPIESAGLDRGTDEGATPWLKYDVPADAVKASPRWGGDGDAPTSWNKYGIKSATPAISTAEAEATVGSTAEREELPEERAAEATPGADVPLLGPVESEAPEAALLSQPLEILAVAETLLSSADESLRDLAPPTPVGIAEAARAEEVPAVVAVDPDAAEPASAIIGVLAEVDPDPILSFDLPVRVEPVRVDTADIFETPAATADPSDAPAAPSSGEPEPEPAIAATELPIDTDPLFPSHIGQEVEPAAALPETARDVELDPVLPPREAVEVAPIQEETASEPAEVPIDATLFVAQPAPEAVELVADTAVSETPTDAAADSTFLDQPAIATEPMLAEPASNLEERPIEEERSLALIAQESVDLAPEAAVPEAQADAIADLILPSHGVVEVSPIDEEAASHLQASPVDEKIFAPPLAPMLADLAPEAEARTDAAADLVLLPQNSVEVSPIDEELTSLLEANPVEEEISSPAFAPEIMESAPDAIVPEALADAAADLVLPPQDAIAVAPVAEEPVGRLAADSAEENLSSTLFAPEPVELAPEAVVPEAQAEAEPDPVLTPRDEVEVAPLSEEPASNLEVSPADEEPSAASFASETIELAPEAVVPEVQAETEPALLPHDAVEVVAVPERIASTLEESPDEKEPSAAYSAPRTVETVVSEAQADVEADPVLPPPSSQRDEPPTLPIGALPAQPPLSTAALARTWFARLLGMAPAARQVAARAVLAALEAGAKSRPQSLADTSAGRTVNDEESALHPSPSHTIEMPAPIEPAPVSELDLAADAVAASEPPSVLSIEQSAIPDAEDVEVDSLGVHSEPEAEAAQALAQAAADEPPRIDDAIAPEPEPSLIATEVEIIPFEAASIEVPGDPDVEPSYTETPGVVGAMEAALGVADEEPAEAPSQLDEIDWTRSDASVETVEIATAPDAAPLEPETQPTASDELSVEMAPPSADTRDVAVAEELTIEPQDSSAATADLPPEYSIPETVDAVPPPSMEEPAALIAAESSSDAPEVPPAALPVDASEEHASDDRAARMALAAELTVVIGDILNTTKYATAITLKSLKSPDARETLALSPDDAEDSESDADIDLAIEEALPTLVAARFGRRWPERALMMASVAMLLAVGFFSYSLWFADDGVVSTPPAIVVTSPPTASGTSMAPQGTGEADTQGHAALRSGAQKPARPGLMNAKSTK